MVFLVSLKFFAGFDVGVKCAVLRQCCLEMEKIGLMSCVSRSSVMRGRKAAELKF